MTNEFDDLNTIGDFEETPEQETDIIGNGNAGIVYDYNKAPDGAAMPKRKDLDKQEVVISKAEIIMPPLSKPWTNPFKGTVKFKPCVLKLHYNNGEQIENYSGTKVFPVESDPTKYSHPTIDKSKQNQASKLVGLYADYKGVHINEVTLKEFMSFLNSKPKAIIEVGEVKNPETQEIIKKNFVGKFV